MPTTIALTVTILVLAPAWLQLGSYERDAAAISAQREPMARREPNSTD